MTASEVERPAARAVHEALILALNGRAKELRRRASSRKHAGPALADYRAELRAEAVLCIEVATRLYTVRTYELMDLIYPGIRSAPSAERLMDALSQGSRHGNAGGQQ